MFDLTLTVGYGNIGGLDKPMRGGAVAARRAHNPKVAGSSPAPATKRDHDELMVSFLSLNIG